MIFVRKYIQYQVPWLELGKISFAAFAMGGATVITYSFLSSLIGGNLAVMGAIIVAVVVYGAGLIISKAVKDEEWYAMPFIGKRLQKRMATKSK